MFYKIIKDNRIIDVNSRLFFWNNKKKVLLLTDSLEKAQYIQSSDYAVFYLANQLNSIPEGAPQFERVDIEFISSDEYFSLKKVLTTGEPVDIVQPDENTFSDETFETPEQPSVVTIGDLAAYIYGFEKKYQNLFQEKIFLEECILELSQELYK